jgi:hypothetical protein
MGSGILVNVTCALHFSEFITSQKVDMHIDSLFQRRYLLEKPTNIYEGLYIATTKDGCETFAKCRENGDRTSHLKRVSTTTI